MGRPIKDNDTLTVEDVERIVQTMLEPYKVLLEKRTGKSLIKVETYNGEEVPEQDYSSTDKMSYDEQLFSILNTIKILPPNLIVKGRHTLENVQALNGRFRITEEMMDDAYSQFIHEDF